MIRRFRVVSIGQAADGTAQAPDHPTFVQGPTAFVARDLAATYFHANRMSVILSEYDEDAYPPGAVHLVADDLGWVVARALSAQGEAKETIGARQIPRRVRTGRRRRDRK